MRLSSTLFLRSPVQIILTLSRTFTQPPYARICAYLMRIVLHQGSLGKEQTRSLSLSRESFFLSTPRQFLSLSLEERCARARRTDCDARSSPISVSAARALCYNVREREYKQESTTNPLFQAAFSRVCWNNIMFDLIVVSRGSFLSLAGWIDLCKYTHARDLGEKRERANWYALAGSVHNFFS